MKEDRNCSYPIYSGPMMPGPLPINGMQMPIPIGAPSTYTSVNYDNNISNQLVSLEQRVTNLENMMGNSSYSTTSYNATNYQMM